MDGLSHVPQAGSRGALGPQKFERPVKQEAPDLSTVPHPQAGLVCAPHPGQPAGMVSSRWSAWRSVSGRRRWVPSGFPRASFEEGSWGLRGSWVLGGPLLGGMRGGGGVHKASWQRGGQEEPAGLSGGGTRRQTSSLPGLPLCGHPVLWAEGMVLRPVGRPVGRWLSWGLRAGQSGFQTPGPGGSLVTPKVTWTGSLGWALGRGWQGPP